jgi:hypothetical protein
MASTPKDLWDTDLAYWGIGMPTHVIAGPSLRGERFCACWHEGAAWSWTGVADAADLLGLVEGVIIELFADDLQMAQEAYRRWPTEEFRLMLGEEVENAAALRRPPCL